MGTVHKTPIQSFLLKTKVEQHKEIKKKVVPLLNTGVPVKEIDHYFGDDVHATDWHIGTDEKRTWVKALTPYLDKVLLGITMGAGYDHFTLDDIWYQKYNQDQTHGWHSHGSNFTGIYYVAYDEDSPATEIVTPWNHKQQVKVDLEEGVLITFPSHVIHRGPQVTNNKTKIIISFNWNMVNPSNACLLKLKHLYK